MGPHAWEPGFRMTDTTDQNIAGNPQTVSGETAPPVTKPSGASPTPQIADGQKPPAPGPQAKGVGVVNLTGGEQISEPAPQSFDRRLVEGPIVPTLLTFSLPLVWSSLMHSVPVPVRYQPR